MASKNYRIRKNFLTIYSFIYLTLVCCTMVKADFKSDSISFAHLRIGYWSTYDIECGIAMYTKHQLTALAAKGCTVFPYSHFMKPQELLMQLIKDKVNILNIQYEPNIMPTVNKLKNFLMELKIRNIKIILTIHEETKDVPALGILADYIIYHKMPNRLRLGGKVCYIPMGVPVFSPTDTQANLRKKYGFSAEHKIITTIGFMLKWKQFPDILEKFVPILKAHPEYRLQMLTSSSPRGLQQCSEVCQEIQTVIDRHKIQDQVVHITSFITQNELSERMWISDLGYLWGGMDTRGTSGAAKEFISARLPVVVSSSSHFHDIRSIAIVTPIDMDIFVMTVASRLEMPHTLATLRLMYERKYETFNYENLILNYIDIFKKLLKA